MEYNKEQLVKPSFSCKWESLSSESAESDFYFALTLGYTGSYASEVLGSYLFAAFHLLASASKLGCGYWPCEIPLRGSVCCYTDNFSKP